MFWNSSGTVAAIAVWGGQKLRRSTNSLRLCGTDLVCILLVPLGDGIDHAKALARMWICDVNGVLIDSIAVVRAAFVATARHYRFTFADADFRRISGLWLLEAYRRLDPAGQVSVRREFHLAYVRERIEEIRAYPGVLDTLVAAKAAGISVGVATSHGEIAEACLVNNGLYPLIDCLVTQEEVARRKPHPDAVMMALALLTTDQHARESGAAVYVGDSVVDVEAGRAAGVRTIGVTYGVSSHSEIAAARPDHIIHRFSDMRSFLSGRLPYTSGSTFSHASVNRP